MAEHPSSSSPHEVPPAIAPPPTWRLRAVQVLTVVGTLSALAAALYFRDRLQDLKQYGYLAVFVVGLVSNATIILPVPGLAVSSVMGGVLSPWIVGVVGGLGQAVGELTSYMAGYSGQTLVDGNPTYDRMVRWMQRYGALTIFVMALIPNPLFDLGGIAAGATRLPVWKFVLSCAAGKVIKNIAFALAGYYGIGVVFELMGS